LTLSNETKGKLAEALIPEVINYLNESEYFTEFLQSQMIPEAITNALGEVDGELKYELSLMIFDSICFFYREKND
jgi:hypothetical protein